MNDNTLTRWVLDIHDNAFTPISLGEFIRLNSSSAGESSICCDKVKTAPRTVHNGYRLPEIKQIIFNDPVTVVYFEDGTKSVVKTSALDKFDKESGLVNALIKRLFADSFEEDGTVSKSAGCKLQKMIKRSIDQVELREKAKREKAEKKAKRVQTVSKEPRQRRSFDCIDHDCKSCGRNCKCSK